MLLLVTGAGAGGALFARFQLDSVSEIIAREARARTGAPLAFDALTTNGLRGFRLENLTLSVATGDGPRVSLVAPLAQIDIDFIEMLSGRLDIERIHADNAHIVIERPPDGHWFNPGATRGRPALPGLGNAAFRVTGNDCTLEVRNIVGDTSLTFTDLAVDISRQLDTDTLHARIGAAVEGERGQRIDVTAVYEAADSFIVQANLTDIDAGDVNVFLPASQHFVASGTVSPRVRVDASPGAPLAVHLETPVDGLTLRDQPEFIGPVNGTLNILAQYDPADSLLSITAAEADTTPFPGSLRGSVRLDGPRPAFDLQLQAGAVPLTPFAELLLPEALTAHGALTLDLDEAASVSVHLTGDTETPIFDASARVAGGRLAFEARNPNYPSGEVELGPSEVQWAPGSGLPTGTVRVLDGTVTSRLANIEAERVSATISLTGDEAVVDPLTFETGGRRFVGNGSYPLEGGPAVVTLRGALPNLEDTMFHNLVQHLVLGGVMGIEGTGTFQAGRVSFDAMVDATQATVGYDWFFQKPPGIALHAQLKGEFALDEPSGVLSIHGDVASSRAEADFQFESMDGQLELATLDADIPTLDVTGVGKCLVLPYRITGGQGTAGRFTWRRVGPRDGENEWSAEVALDEISLLSEGATTPIWMREAQVHVASENYPERIAQLRLRVSEGAMPPFGQPWFKGIDREDPRWADVEEGGEREWRFDIAADDLSLPPWKGRSFEGEAYRKPGETGLERFSATIGEEGWLRGLYHEDTEENHFELTVDWDRVPVEMFLNHLELAPLLDGKIDGEIRYEMDRDDPATREGEGWFTVRDGQFATQFFAGVLGGDPDGEAATLPLALTFESFSSEVVFDGDVVRTPSVTLQSTQLTADAAGQFIHDGDMEYEIRVSITPDTAAQIPALRDSFNIEGLRVSQQNVDLAFQVTGPMFDPQGSVAQLPPLRVALVSSALGITTEVIDIPRKILFDLLKLGGGIIGATR